MFRTYGLGTEKSLLRGKPPLNIDILNGEHMGCSQNYGPLLVIDHITAPNS